MMRTRRSLRNTPKTIERKNHLINELEKEAMRLKKEINKAEGRRTRELAQRRYAILISRIKEIKNPSPKWNLTRYE